MLTTKILKANKGLEGLNPEQLSLIATLSENDENAIIGQKTKDIHDKYDLDIKTLTGKEKPNNVKSYEHMKTVIGEYIKTANESGTVQSSLNGKITSLKAEKADLLKKIGDGEGNEALRGQIATLTQSITDKNTELSTVKSTFEKERGDFELKIKNQGNESLRYQVDHSIGQYLIDEKVQFIESPLLKETLANRKELFLLSLKPERKKDEITGKEIIIYRDDKGDVLINQSNAFKPYTAGELYLDKVKDLVKEGRSQGGGGTGSGGSGGTPTNLDMSGVTTQFQASEVVTNHLLQNEGLTKTDKRFSERQIEINKEFEVNKMPLK